MLVPPQQGKPFKLYISADDKTIRSALMQELRHYLLSAECTVVSKADVVKHMLSMPILNGRVEKWILALSEFDLKYESTKAVKDK